MQGQVCFCVFSIEVGVGLTTVNLVVHRVKSAYKANYGERSSS